MSDDAVLAGVKKFNEDLEVASRQVLPHEFRNFISFIALTLADLIIDKNPVGNSDNWIRKPKERYVGGRSRGNWQVTVNHPTEQVIDTIDANGTKTKMNAKAVIATQVTDDNAIGSVIYIGNNVPYIIPLENGHSKTQTPNGMVKVSLAEVRSMFP